MSHLQARNTLRSPSQPATKQRLAALAFKPAVRGRPFPRPAAAALHQTSTVPSSAPRSHERSCGGRQKATHTNEFMQLAVPLLLVSGAAQAEVVSPEVEAVYAAAAADGAPTDVIVTVMAGIVFALLVVVTGGVAYLNIRGWLDDRQEKQDREAPVVSRPAASAASSSDEDQEARKRVRVKREKRGFGGN